MTLEVVTHLSKVRRVRSISSNVKLDASTLDCYFFIYADLAPQARGEDIATKEITRPRTLKSTCGALKEKWP